MHRHPDLQPVVVTGVLKRINAGEHRWNTFCIHCGGCDDLSSSGRLMHQGCQQPLRSSGNVAFAGAAFWQPAVALGLGMRSGNHRLMPGPAQFEAGVSVFTTPRSTAPEVRPPVLIHLKQALPAQFTARRHANGGGKISRVMPEDLLELFDGTRAIEVNREDSP